jgi:hypothetical protein
MNKIRWVFIIAVLVIFAFSVFTLNQIKVEIGSTIDEISDFQITRISAKGKVLISKNGFGSSQGKPVDLQNMQYSKELYVSCDSQTAFEFFYKGAIFKALPGSQLHFRAKSNDLILSRGELYWNRESEDRKIKMSIMSSNNDSSSTVSIEISDEGHIRFFGSQLDIWNYSGRLMLRHKDGQSNLKPLQKVELLRGQIKRFRDIIPAPSLIAPEDLEIDVKKLDDSNVRFSWKADDSVKSYVVKLFSSDLMENLIHRETTYSNKVNVNLINFSGFSEFYWHVVPYDLDERIEGVPSKLGHIFMRGDLLTTDSVLKPPVLIVEPITVSGSVVLIKGVAEVGSELFIDDIPKSVDGEGKFLHTITYKKVGTHTIVFKLVSPYKVETILEKQVNIYDE